MKLTTSFVALAMCMAVQAEDTLELRWKFEKGDRFSLEVNSDVTQSTHDAGGDSTVKSTLKLSAQMEVVDLQDGVAKVEFRVTSTSGKQSIKSGGTGQDKDWGTKEADWKDPVLATISPRGLLVLDQVSLTKALQGRVIPVGDAIGGAFQPLPETAVKPKEPWTVSETAIPETWELTTVKGDTGKEVATMSGRPADKSEGGNADETTSIKGTMSAEFDVGQGHMKSTTLKRTTESRVSPKAKPTSSLTQSRTVTLKKLPAAGK